MPWTVSHDVEEALWQAASRLAHLQELPRGALSAAIIARSRRYTSERESLHRPLAPGELDGDLAARAVFFTVADAAKIMIPLAELDRDALLPRTGPLSILDVGAGTGAMTLGVLDYLRRADALAGRSISIRAIDRDSRALAILGDAVATLAARWNATVTVERDCRAVERSSSGPAGGLHSADRGGVPGAEFGLAGSRDRFDLVLLGGLLNELDEGSRPGLVRAASSAAGSEGTIICIEPALRETSRDLHRLRDWVIENQLARVVAPCVRRLAPCPALADERDWCHEDRATVLPPRAGKLAGTTGLRSHGLKFAYLVLRPTPGEASEAGTGGPGGQEVVRVVSQLRKSKGKIECFACGDTGRVSLRLLRRDRSAENRPFERLGRGDLAVIPRRLAGGGDVARDDAIGSRSLDPP